MLLLHKEIVMSKQEIVKQTFDQTLDKNIERLVTQELIRQMFDRGLFRIEKIIDASSLNVFIRVSILVEKP